MMVTSWWFSVEISYTSYSTPMAWYLLPFLDLFMWVWLDIGFPILIISLWVCITCLSNYGCFLAIIWKSCYWQTYHRQFQCGLSFKRLGTFPHFSGYVLGNIHPPYHHIGWCGHLGLYALGFLDVDTLSIFHKLYLVSVSPIKMVYHWPYCVQFLNNFLP